MELGLGLRKSSMTSELKYSATVILGQRGKHVSFGGNLDLLKDKIFAFEQTCEKTFII